MIHPPVPLGTFPTPLEPAPRLAAALGLGPDDLWVKRGRPDRPGRWREQDPEAGVGGGRGPRRGRGHPGDHRCPAEQPRPADRRRGRPARPSVVLVLRAAPPGASRSGNLALDGLFGARLAWAGAVDQAGLDAAAAEVCARLRGRRCPSGADPVRRFERPGRTRLPALRCGTA